MGNSNTYNLYELQELVDIDSDIGDLIPYKATHELEEQKDGTFMTRRNGNGSLNRFRLVCGHDVNFYLKKLGASPGVELQFKEPQTKLMEAAEMTKNPPPVNHKAVPYDAR